MLIDQISVFVENKKGALKDILGILAEGNIDLRAISIADTSDFGILRMIVSNPGKTLELLKSKGVTASKTAVIGCKLQDQPGALYQVLDTLSDVSVEYIYAFIARHENDAYVIIRAEDNELAQNILQNAGYSFISSSF
jgi:hypothetical protein